MSEGIGKYVDVDVTINADAIYSDSKALLDATGKSLSEAQKAAEIWVDTSVVSPVVEGYNTAQYFGNVISNATSGFGNDVKNTTEQYVQNVETGTKSSLGLLGLALANAGLWLTNTSTGVDLTKR